MTPMPINPSSPFLALTLFALAVLHTFSVKIFQHLAKKFHNGSIGENLFHLLGEVEIVFGFWSLIYLVSLSLFESQTVALNYIDSRNFNEPLFVMAVMLVASTKPIIDLAIRVVHGVARFIPLPRGMAFYLSCMVIGPLIGSLITEPAAMTVTAMILLETLFHRSLSTALRYATLGLLFVSVSIGGTLTHFAAPPVVMVARAWGWDSSFMFLHFGDKAVLSIVLSTLLVLFRFRKELQNLTGLKKNTKPASPLIMSLIHVVFLSLIVLTSHHPKIFLSLLLFFIGFAHVTREYQHQLKIRESLLVGFFLGGLVTLGGVQEWWVSDIVTRLDSLSLFSAATGLTAIFDNAALTYLGSLVPNLSAASQYFLVAGAVVGGGLTVIANAPNPIGYGLLSSEFGDEGISPLKLFKAASIPTMIAFLCFWFL